MSTTTDTTTTGGNLAGTTSDTPEHVDQGGLPQRKITETKAAFKTTEFIVYTVAVVAVIVTANMVDGQNGGADPFGAAMAIRYIVYLTLAYMLARGLAKSGSRERYDA